MTRDMLQVLIDRMLNAEMRTTPPPASEEGDWLYGSVGFTEPDSHGWMAPSPSVHVWTPRALVFWRMVIRMGAHVSDGQRRDPRLSLARWPAIDAAVRQLQSLPSREASIGTPSPEGTSGVCNATGG